MTSPVGSATLAVSKPPVAAWRLATVSEDFTARLWDAATGAQVLRLGFSPQQTYKVRWSGDGQTLAVVPMDGTVRLLDGMPVR